MLKYEEIFLSIQGESRDSGIPTIFIRLFGCPFNCSYCDQPQDGNPKSISVIDLVEKVKEFKVKNVCITGGEPLIQKQVFPLVKKLSSLGYKISIETSGCVPIKKLYDNCRYVMDVKCPSSGISHMNVLDNLYKLSSEDEIKFVIKDRKDYDYMKELLKKCKCIGIPASVLVSPMFHKNKIVDSAKDLVNWILCDKLDVRIQVQIHKILEVK